MQPHTEECRNKIAAAIRNGDLEAFDRAVALVRAIEAANPTPRPKPLMTFQFGSKHTLPGAGFYVYIISKHDKSPIYVGKGIGDRVRAHGRGNRNNRLKRTLAKHGGVVSIVACYGDSVEDEILALAEEARLIAKYGRADRRQGPLYNVTDGGDGGGGTCFGRYADLIGRVFGRLTVIEKATRAPSGGIRWVCSCECGGSATVFSANLLTNNTVSCGCAQREHARKVKAPDLTGQRFGHLTVLSRAGIHNRGALWRCYCDCGNEKEVTAGNLRGKTRSCGCLKRKMLVERNRRKITT